MTEIEGREVRFPKNKYDLVTYVPQHADGNAGHEDCEKGVLIMLKGCHNVMVLYSKSRTIQSTRAEDLVWG